MFDVVELVRRQSPVTARYDWILAITFIAYFFSAFGNGANDVANVRRQANHLTPS